MDAMESDHLRRGQALPALNAEDVAAPPPSTTRGNLLTNYATLVSKKLIRISTMTWLMWLSITFSYYSFFTWIPSLLIQNGMTITKSFGYSLVMYIAQIPGYFSAAWFNERIGRQATIVSYMLLGGLCALGLAFTHSDAQIMVAGVLLSFFMNGTYAGVYAYTPEVFPTQVRATGSGLASAIGRIGGITAPILVGFIYPTAGFAGVFGMTTAVLLLGAAAVTFMGIPDARPLARRHRRHRTFLTTLDIHAIETSHRRIALGRGASPCRHPPAASHLRRDQRGGGGDDRAPALHHPGPSPPERESERVYTNMREAYPVGGRKPITDSPWMQQVMQRGLPYIGRNADDLRDVFYDHELIVSLGCRSVLNIPLRWQGETLGTLNMLHEENWYDTGHIELARVFAQLAVPAVMAQQQTKESMA
jgi:hypothetical protein